MLGLRGLIKQIRGYSSIRNTKTRISFPKLWGRYWLDNQNSNHSDMFKKLTINQYTDGVSTYSQTNLITSYFTIDKYPAIIVKGFKELIQASVTGYAKVRVSFIDTYDNDYINWESPQIKARLKTWNEIDQQEAGLTTAYNAHERIIGDSLRNHRSDSLIYYAQAVRKRNRHLFKVRTMIVVTGERGDNYDKAIRHMLEQCRQIGLGVSKVDGDVEQYLQAYSPFSLIHQSQVFKDVGNPTMTDEILAQTYSYTQGKVGSEGQYWGTDVESGFPVFKLIKKDPKDPENILITGQTGSGKSFYAKTLILQLICDARFKGTIMDFEGTEYGPIVNYVREGERDPKQVVVVNMGIGSGNYFDPVPICNVNVHGDQNKDVFVEENNPYEMSKSYTNSLLSVICCRERKPSQWEERIIYEAIENMYREAGVTRNPSTWARSQTLSVHSVYTQFEKMYNYMVTLCQRRDDGQKLYGKDALLASPEYTSAMRSIMIQVQSTIGNPNDTYFAHPIRLEDIATAKLVVCSFGMLGRDQGDVPPLQMALMSSSASIISHIRSLYSKAQGKLNYKVWEEFQRWSVLPGSVDTIRVALTGGRKLGDANIIITNDIKPILQNDQFALIDNLTTMCIGLIGDAETRSMIIDKWPELEPLKGSLDIIASTIDRHVAEKYKNAFLIFLDRRVATVSRMSLPKSLAKSDLFKTAVELKKD